MNVTNLFQPPEPAADVPDTMDVSEAAARLGMHDDTVRRGIREDMQDGGRRIPGGRHIGSKYLIIRAVFERAMRDGVEPERKEIVAPAVDLDAVRRLVAELDKALG